MIAQEQIPAIDAEVARIDKRINRCRGDILGLEKHRDSLEAQIERKKRYLQELGRLRSEKATFRLL